MYDTRHLDLRDTFLTKVADFGTPRYTFPSLAELALCLQNLYEEIDQCLLDNLHDCPLVRHAPRVEAAATVGGSIAH